MSEHWLLLDIGNTHTVAGVFTATGNCLVERRFRTDPHCTADEYRVQLRQLFHDGLGRSVWDLVDRIILSTVVPTLERVVVRTCATLPCLSVNARLARDFEINLPQPEQLGADRLCNVAGALQLAPAPLLIIDAGTATTFCLVDAKRGYIGGAIAPGLETSWRALQGRAAKLFAVELIRPDTAVGNTTETQIQSGVLLGYEALIEGMADRLLRDAELAEVTVLLTGGCSSLIRLSDRFRLEPDLTLRGFFVMGNSMASNILIAVTGSISAYKIADVVSALVKQGHQVQCVVTESAKQFVTPLVLETLSGRAVKSALFGPGVSGTEHIDLARWADIFVVAPATANVLAKLALGLTDDLVTTVALATTAPLLLAPAMNTVMWEHPATQQHLQTLQQRGAHIVNPAAGTLACGEVGVGKLAPVETIIASIEAALAPPTTDLAKLRVLITAGPTTSPIDAVRYITNHSTGRMGAAMAEEALRRGAQVRYVLGTDKGVVRPIPPPGSADRLTLVEVQTAEQMAKAALAFLPNVDGVIATAAVLDYRVATPSANKLKRAAAATTLDMMPSVDVLGALRQAATGQWFLGFAAETDAVEANGRGKLISKQLDFLFANPVAKVGETATTGFSVSTNGGTLFRTAGDTVQLPVMSKSDVAKRLWDLIV